MKQDLHVRDERPERPQRRRGVAGTVALLTLVLALGLGVGAWAFLYGGRELLADLTAPEPVDTDAVDGLDLDVGAAYVSNRFGPARTVVDACTLAPCTDPALAGLTLSVHETASVVVRALSVGDELQAYLLTTTSEAYRPEVDWLRRPLGAVGRSTAAEMLDAIGPGVRPGDTAIATDPRPVYVDVVPVGAPGSFRGVVLAWSPDGSGDSFDMDAAAALAAEGGGDLPTDLVEGFRAGTTPNTVGLFRDRGPVGAWLHDADTVRALLLAGAGF